MKKLFLNLFALFICSLSIGQILETKNSTYTLVEARSIYLNGGMKADLGGKSRVLVPIDLPENTVEWYYSFSTSAGESGLKNLGLAIQLTAFLLDPSGVTSGITSQIEVPAGSKSIDVYLLDEDNRRPFKNKSDKDGGTYYYNLEGSTENTKQAVVRVDDVLEGRYYLGLKNPSIFSAINITIEVIAIVSEEIEIDEWSEENKIRFTTKCKSNFQTVHRGQNEVCQCLNSKITDSFSPSIFFNLSEISQEEIFESELDACFESTGNQQLKLAEEKYIDDLINQENEYEALNIRISKLIQESKSSGSSGDYADAKNKSLSALKDIQSSARIKNEMTTENFADLHNDIAFYSILTNDLNVAFKHVKKGLSYSPEDMYLRENLGLYYLLSDNYPEAKKAFSYYDREDILPDGTKWYEQVGNELDLLQDLGMDNIDFLQVKMLLKIF